MAGKSGKKKQEKTAEKLTDKERIDKGQILARVIIEVLGAPKAYVEESIGVVVDKVRTAEGLEVISESTYEAEEKGKLFTTFSEIEIWFEDMDCLSQFLFNFTPSSIEIMQPTTLPIKANILSAFFNDFLLKMHDLGLKLKDTSAKSQLLQKNTDALIRNFFNMVLSEPRSLEDAAKLTGIPKENVEAILSNFEKAGIVRNSGGVYSLVKEKKKEG